jgi:creatinine amidohydrolase
LKPWILSEVNYAYVKEHPYQVAVLPLGATEPHNLHLPYGTDMYEGTTVGEKICAAAHAGGAKVVLLPTIPYGTETNQMQFPLAMNVDPSTLFAFVTDLVKSLDHHGVHKLVLLNSHGGNDLKPLLRELYGKTRVHVFLCNWYLSFKDVELEIFGERDDHAGEMETSFGLAYFPDLVARNSDGSLAADAGATKQTRFDAINKGWVSITRPWHLLTTNSGAGNPHGASAEKGERMMQIVVERLSKFLVELSAAKLDENFPF